MRGEFMRIGETAQRAGVNVQTIRFYERRGLLAKPRRLASGYRDYASEDVRRIVAVKRAQKLGFTLSEIQELMRLEQPGQHIEQVRSVAVVKIRDIDEKVRSLKSLRKSLEALLRNAANTNPQCPVLEEDK
jgi:DNA-binding transcriptional MerR regulator